MKFVLSSLAFELNAQCYQVADHERDMVIDGCSIDTRSLQPNQAFLAFKGEQVDGHDFIEQAQLKNAAVAIVTRPRQIKFPQLVVQDIQEALVKMALWARKQFNGKVIGLTGSSGKTTTRQLIEHILIQQFKVSSSVGNQNNELGVPLALTNLNAEADVFIAEMGARKQGDIAYLMKMVLPDVSLVTNIGESHLEIFGSRANIAATKSEIFSELKPEGIAVINQDDSFASLLAVAANERKTITFSFEDAEADLYIDHIQLFDKESTFDFYYRGIAYPCRLSVAGLHQVKNALAAMATAIACDADVGQFIRRLENFILPQGRSLPFEGSWGGLLIDDAYNANPSSVKAAIDLLMLQPERRFLVLGDMLELGEESLILHEEVVSYAISKGINFIYLFGDVTAQVEVESYQFVFHFSDKFHLLKELKSQLKPNDVVLIKGSRSMAMDELIPSLIRERG